MSDRSVDRAARLVRLYPRAWREQFPDFGETVAAELDEHARGVRRDVVRTAALEHLRHAGLLPARPDDEARSGLALIYAALVPFAGLALGMWSQLHTGVATLGAATPAALRASNLLLTLGALVVLVAGSVAVVLLTADAWKLRHRRATRGSALSRPISGPLIVFMGSLCVLTVTGWGADRSGWYSPAAAALPSSGPGHPATFWVRGIIATITPAWVHPTLFTRMPGGELVAALVGPVAALSAAAALFRLIMRLPLRASRRANIGVAATAIVTMLVSVIACGRWMLDHPTRQGATTLLARTDQVAPGHTGWAVVGLLTVLTFVALVGLRRLLRSRPDGPTRAGGAGPPAAELAAPDGEAVLHFRPRAC